MERICLVLIEQNHAAFGKQLDNEIMARAAALYGDLQDPVQVVLQDLDNPAPGNTVPKHGGKLGRRLGSRPQPFGDIDPLAGHEEQIQPSFRRSLNRQPDLIRGLLVGLAHKAAQDPVG